MSSTLSKAQVEVITSVQRRRRWSRAEKERLVAAAIAPGAVASEVAREAGIYASQLFRWRQELCDPAQTVPAFSAVVVAPEPGAVSASEQRRIGEEARAFLVEQVADDGAVGAAAELELFDQVAHLRAALPLG